MSKQTTVEAIKLLATELAAALQQTIERLDQHADATPQLLTPEQVAQMLGITAETLCRWRMAGKGPAHLREGKFVRYTMADIQRWMNPATSSAGVAGEGGAA